MATPRLFVSSTCYDLQEIRFQLRSFIQDYGYEAVLSEFDDIFFDYNKHVQDSCLDEIPKCQLFILIIGNNYGSFYHKENSRTKIPDSVTLQEFKKALNHRISKHLFINKFVDYDYNNYKRALNNYISEHFKKNDINDNEVNEVSNMLRDKFNNQYHFPFESYKLIFPFLDIVYELNEGNSRSTFESFTDIKTSLKKQWAGLIYEALTSKRNATQAQAINIESKLDNIEKNINKLISSRTSAENGSITLNVDDLIKEVKIDELEKLQDRIEKNIYNICHYRGYEEYNYNEWVDRRFIFLENPTVDLINSWLETLKTLVKNYKWSKYINIEMIFDNIKIEVKNNNYVDVDYKDILELHTIYNSIDLAERDSFAHSIQNQFLKNYDGNIKGGVALPFKPNDDEDLPF